MQLEAWHWGIAGILLALLEIFIPSFTVIWFGVGAIITAILIQLFSITQLEVQLLIWLIFSCVQAGLWFSIVNPKLKAHKRSQHSSDAAIGERGMVITNCSLNLWEQNHRTSSKDNSGVRATL